jgi:signal transduction histidine kinase/HPt (histidine-containing phosphotransfer) domain-containing protein
MKILIVDDSHNGALALQMQLLGNGYDRVFIEYSAQGAFDFLNSQPTDDPCRLILMDICMPEMDGIEATKWLKNQPEFRNIPVVMVSGDDDIERLSQAFKAGAMDFIRKSSEETELIARVESVLRFQREKEQRIAHEKDLKLLTEKFKKKAHEAEMANRLKSQFLANMSHEIRTPMNGIIGMASLALANNKSPVIETYLKSVQNSAQVLLNLLNDILDLSSIESEKIKMEHIEFGIRETIEQSITLFAKKAYEKEIELILNFDHSIPEKAIGDPYRLTQILNNLISNAIKFTSEGAITVSVQLLKQNERNLQLTFAVQDTGVGIDPRHHNRIFKVFTQADSSTTRKYGGTGLGLTICKKLVEKMEGKIWIESQLHEGSTFFFTPCFFLPDKQPAKKNWFPDHSFSSLKAIVFDNMVTAGEAAVASLFSIGVKAFQAKNSVTLMQYLNKSDSVDLIVINNFLENTEGLILAQEIRTNLSITQPKIILMCGLGIEVPQDQIKKSGIDAVVYRPLTRPNLANAIIKAFKPELLEKNISDRAADIYQYKDIHALLVEDNEINIDVALGILKMANIHKVDIAKNGLEAVDKIKKSFHANQAFDFVLMDVQMPKMDGLEATQAIRTFETSFLSITDIQKTRLPIIAMTAHAMNGDKENCIGAGMDDYISKPLSLDSLIEKVDQWVFFKRKEKQSIAKKELVFTDQKSGEAQKVLDMDDAIKRLSGQKELYKRLLKRFFDEYEHVDQDIKTALDQKNYSDAHRLTHTIKGLASSLSAIPMRDCSLELEKAINNQDTAKIQPAFNSFQVEAKRLNDAIQSIINPKKDIDIESTVLKIADIDAQTALKRLSGNMELFVRILKKFYQDYQDYLSKIKDAFLSKNLEKLKIEAHTLKGVANYLASDSLLDAAKNLEIYATEKRYEQIQKVIDVIEDIIVRIVYGIRYVIQNESPEKSAASFTQIPQTIQDKFSILNKLLVDSDSEIKDKIQEFESELNQCSIPLAAKRYLNKMVRDINSYQFENAQKSLQLLADSFKIKIVENEVTQ